MAETGVGGAIPAIKQANNKLIYINILHSTYILNSIEILITYFGFPTI